MTKQKKIIEVFTNYGYIDLETITQNDRTGEDTGDIKDVLHFIKYLEKNNILYSQLKSKTPYSFPIVRYEAPYSVIKKLIKDEFDKSGDENFIDSFVRI